MISASPPKGKETTDDRKQADDMTTDEGELELEARLDGRHRGLRTDYPGRRGTRRDWRSALMHGEL